MQAYRLFLSDGSVLEMFEASDHVTAERYGRLLAQRISRMGRVLGDAAPGFRIDRRGEDAWRLVVFWVPVPQDGAKWG